MFTLRNVKYKNILSIPKLDIPTAQATCIVGKSGSGKSTLLKLLNHLISYDQGSIQFNGKPIESYDSVDLRRQVVMLPQTPALFGETVKDNLLIGLHFAEKSPVPDKQLQKALHAVHLDKDLEEKAEQLSGGEQQRLALGRMLLMDAPVYLLDEPTSALDEELEEVVMQSFFDAMKDKQKTIVIVTHSNHLAHQFADQIIDIRPFTVTEESSYE
ncbi:ABC transporter ATP-binding protein [Melghirimyces algeriensis]|uniref:Putative ABC transport system ATP-binding protein n=1 Tax=Melghirimyces algeriensis TaxID=910412 RepID=A0A521CEY9_9BACL|nr:ATP-binding cassette domain-containing protein [Melghirimyces algeriensis]SMO57994.1 putative ABC transport system ATP-binding protein [Melghirimyces algeriensis]